MKNELTSFLTALCHTHSVNYVIKTALDELEQVLTCHTFLTVCLYEVVLELLLENTVVSSGLLLLTKLHSIFSLLLVSCAVLTGSGASAVECTLAGGTSVALKEELGTFSTAKLT
jgi:hypothetical protein